MGRSTTAAAQVRPAHLLCLCLLTDSAPCCTACSLQHQGGCRHKTLHNCSSCSSRHQLQSPQKQLNYQQRVLPKHHSSSSSSYSTQQRSWHQQESCLTVGSLHRHSLSGRGCCSCGHHCSLRHQGMINTQLYHTRSAVHTARTQVLCKSMLSDEAGGVISATVD